MSHYMLGFMDTSTSNSRYNGSLRPVATPPAGNFHRYRNARAGEPVRRLRPSIDEAMDRSAQDFDESETLLAKKAISELMSTMDSLDFGELPLVEFTDFGTLTLQWEKEGRGVLLSFSGDGIFGFSLNKEPGDSYSSTYQEREVKDGIDPHTRSEIAWISNLSGNAEAA